MKIKILLPAAALFFTAMFTSCKKDDASNSSNAQELSTTFELSAAQGRADYITQDANDILNEVAADKGLQGNGFAPGTSQQSFVSCAAVTVTPQTGFPKTIVINFGTGCTSPNGITRSGIINVVLSDSLRRPNSTAVMTFNNYVVRGFKKEGTITWRNTSTASVRSWNRKCENGKITSPAGNYWLHAGEQDIVQTAGISTPINLMDDAWSITGGHTVTNAAGRTRTSTILSALQKKFACNFIDAGSVKIQGPLHFAVIDYGNGVCDDIATVSIDGQPAQTIQL